MDRYEYKLKLEQLKNLVEEKDYEKAAEIADSINWRKVKSSATLCMVGEIYDRIKRYEDSHEILLMAYDRAAVGRNILYRLTLVALKMGNVDEAKEYYEEFLEVAPYDNQKYILRYQIAKLSGAGLEELIDILEEFKEREYIEEWAFELAYLYHRAGSGEKCVEVCDDLVLWFGDGKYVEKALELKMLYQPLNREQEEKYRQFKQFREGVVEVRPTDMLESGEIIQETMKIPDLASGSARFNTSNLQAEIARSMQQIMDANTKELVSDTMDNIKKMVEEIPYLQVPSEDDSPVEEEEQFGYIETEEEIDGSLRNDFEELLAEDWDGQVRLSMQGGIVREPQVNGQMDIQDVLAEWERTRQAAEVAMATAQERRLVSAKARALQEAQELLKRLNEIIPKLEAGISPQELLAERYLHNLPPGQLMPDERGIRPDLVEGTEVSEEMQMYQEAEMPEEMQMYQEAEMPEEMQMYQEAEMPEETQMSEDYNVSEEDQLPDIHVPEEGLMPEKDQIPEDNEQQFLTSDKISSWEEAAKILGEPIPKEYLEKMKRESESSKNFSQETEREFYQEPPKPQEPSKPQEPPRVQESPKPQEPPRVQESPKPQELPKPQEALKPQASLEELIEQEAEKSDEQDEKDAGKYLRSVFQAARESREEKASIPKLQIEEPEEHIRKLSKEQKEIFSYFVPITGMEQQLCQVLEGSLHRKGKDNTSSSGNILITGGRGSGKTVLATDFIKAIQKSGRHPGGKVGKITGESLNQKDLTQLIRKVAGGYLIIEKAGDISKKTATGLSLLMEQNTDGLLVIMEDTRKGIDKALSQDANFARKFTERVKIPVFTSDELVEFAKAYALEQECEIDDMGILALYNRISNIQKLDEATTLTEVKEILDEAISRAEHGGLKKFFGGKKFSPEGYLYLREKDFED